MSKIRKQKQKITASMAEPGHSGDTSAGTADAPATPPTGRSTRVMGYLRRRLWLVGVVLVLTMGILGAGLKYLEEDAKRVGSPRVGSPRVGSPRVGSPHVSKGSLFDTINPFLTPPSPTPTPQLSKEYIYAGSRLLAVEDANASAAPPADLAVWRPSTGVWYVLGGPGSAQTIVQWGQSTDIPVPGDYDGDGKTDFSIFRPGTNEWWVLRSSDGTYYAASFGTSGDTPAAADFDGDGKTDLAVFRTDDPSAGLATWYVLPSSTGSFYGFQFGLSTDVPSPADFDGDGKADIAVYRDSNSTFYSLNSANGQLQTANLAVSPGGTPVSADYDGDGKANYALKSGNSWIIMNAAYTGTTSTTWQNSGDIPVPNDYDGDGIVDIAAWRDSNGDWYIQQSSLIGQSGELRQVQWGMSGDIPVPAFYRR